MKKTTMDAPRAREPRPTRDRTTALPDGALVCSGCGIAVVNPDPSTVATVAVWAPVPMSRAVAGVPRAFYTVEVARCDECSARRRRAASLVALHGLGRELGNVAVDRLDAALAGLELLTITGDATAPLTRTAADTLRLIDIMQPSGAGALWSSRLASGTPVDECAARRWSCVPDEAARAAAEGYHALVHRRMEVIGPVRPPSGEAGCLFCGVGDVVALPSDADSVWGDVRRVDVAALGSRRSGVVTGYLCPTCRGAVAWRSVGVPTVKLALLAHLGYEVRNGYELELPMLVAWSALRPGTPANSTPWEHFDTASMPSRLKRLIQQGVVRKIGEPWPAGGVIGWTA